MRNGREELMTLAHIVILAAVASGAPIAIVLAFQS